MKNKIIALMAVIPLIILFTIMSLTTSVSVAISIPVSGVIISTETTEGVLTIDMAEYMSDKYLQVEVLPQAAANREYKLVFEEVEGSETGEVEITDDGLILPKKTGMVKVSAVTNDGGFRDSIIINVISTKALGVTMSAYSLSETSEQYEFRPSAQTGINLEVTVKTGKVRFAASPYPAQVAADVTYQAQSADGNEGAFSVNPVTGIADIRMSGEYLLTVTTDPSVAGYETTLIKVIAEPSAQFTVNGYHSADGEEGRSVQHVAVGTEQVRLYVECPEEPTLPSPLPEGVKDADTKSLGEGRYAVDVTFAQALRENDAIDLTLRSGALSHTVTMICSASVTELFGVNVYEGSFIQKTGSTVTYAALTEPATEGMTYRFEVLTTGAEIISVEGAQVRIKAVEAGETTLRVYTVTGDTETLADERRILIVNGVSSVAFTENAETRGIGGVFATGGKAYDTTGVLRTDETVLGVQITAGDGTVYDVAGDDVLFEVSDPSVATLTVRDGVLYLTATGNGRVTVNARWKYTTAFNDNIKATLTVDCVGDGVNVSDYDALVAATEAGLPVVLKDDVMLGENVIGDDGTLVAGGAEKLRGFVKQLPTTADWKYYENIGQSQPTVNYCIEFKNDVYGNGYEINADYITAVTPSVSASASVFNGPLCFVSANNVASVMAQDNIVFLVRTDGVVLDNVVLKGCKDESLYHDGKFELSYLNFTGTTLELMADCRVVNCRISNGRTTLRAFGRDGVSLKDSAVDPDAERMDVTVESCIISNAREFLVKLGTNRKVVGRFVQSGSSSADYDESMMSPALSAAGKTFAPRNDDNLNDADFVENFVLTHMTLSDSALYNSGLFAIGFESCFAGPMLDGGAIPLTGWDDIGGTSYSAVLKLAGDVRIYDWKSLDYVDSSTLIEVSGTSESTAFLQLNIKQMLQKVRDFGGEQFANLICSMDGGEYVHGGIAFYGGGKNYGILDLSEFEGERMTEYTVNLGILAQGEPSNSMLYLQGTMLPLAAGTEDFRFFMYDAASDFGYAEQQKLIQSGAAYDFIVPAPHEV